MIKSVKGMVALVTGGASGLGLATVHRLLKHGARVAVCDLPSAHYDNIEISKDVITTPSDVTSEEDIKKTLSIVEEKFGQLDAVVNCAAIGMAYKIYNFNKNTTHNLDDFERLQKVNCFGTFNVNRLAVGLMSKNNPDTDGSRGVIINTSGVSAFEGEEGQTTYSSSCGSLVSMTLPLARDLASVGIRCCTIAPGHFDTPLMRYIPEDILEFLQDTVQFPSRLGNPDEFAHLVQFILENPMINGETIRIDGGLRLHL